MALTREEKTQLIEEMSGKLEESKAVVFTEYRGMTMKDAANLREKLREAGISYKITKTTLLKLALQKANMNVPDEILDKPLAAAFSREDEVVPAKLIVAAGKEIEALKIIGGLINRQYMDNGSIKQLAALPGREELYGKVVGSVASPLTSMVGVLQGNIRGLVAVLTQRQAKIN